MDHISNKVFFDTWTDEWPQMAGWMMGRRWELGIQPCELFSAFQVRFYCGAL